MTQNNVGIYASQISGHLYSGPYGSYDSLATTTLSTSTTTVSFSGIPSGYKHLQIRALVRSSKADTTDMPWVRINGSSTGSDYVSHSLSGNGSTVYSGGVTDGSDSYIRFNRMAAANNTSGIFSVFIMDILDYGNTSKYKTIRTLGGNDTNGTDGWVYFGSGLYKNTSAITSLTFGCSNDFVTYSQFALYGVK